MEPFDISSIVNIPHPSPSSMEQQPTQNPASPTPIEYIAAIAGIVIVVVFIVYFKKHR
jgi:hypothetical protein